MSRARFNMRDDSDSFSDSDPDRSVDSDVPGLLDRENDDSSSYESSLPELIGRAGDSSSDESDDNEGDFHFPGAPREVRSSSDEDENTSDASSETSMPILRTRGGSGSVSSDSSVPSLIGNPDENSDSDNSMPTLLRRDGNNSQSEDDSLADDNVAHVERYSYDESPSSDDNEYKLTPIPSWPSPSKNADQTKPDEMKENRGENKVDDKKKSAENPFDIKWRRITGSIAVDTRKWSPVYLEVVLGQFNMDPLSCRDAQGQTLLHLAVIANNNICADWLIKEKRLDPNVTNSDGKTALDIAEKRETKNRLRRLQKWYIQEKRKEEERLERQRIEMATKIQAVVRMCLARKELRRLREACPYSEWMDVIFEVMNYESSRKRIPDSACKSWTDLKRDLDLVVQDDPDLVGDAALQVDDADDDDLEFDRELEKAKPGNKASTAVFRQEQQPAIHSVQLTSDVLTWIRRQKDQTYVEMFTKRLKQLAQGDRSYCLCKALKGSTRLVTETKLDKGMRIIWTQRQNEILVWFVCKHKHISRCLDRVNLSYERVYTRGDAENGNERGVTQFYDSTNVQDEAEDEPEMLVSPFSNVPLKIHALRTTEIDNLVTNGEWTPPIKLTKQEEEIVKKEGTVLVLGRSGTGKTLCVCNRIDRDRQILGQETRQLFLARTKRLCGFVKRLVTKTTTVDENLEFKRVVDWVEDLRKEYGDSDGDRWMLNKHINYRSFCNQIWGKIQADEKELDELQVWTQIRSFIKGSFESALAKRPLTENEYLSLSKDRCRLDERARRKAYVIFQRYQRLVEEHGWWDDMDRVTEVVHALKETRSLYSEPLYDKIYVDEVQDITQSEIGLFFLVSGSRPDSLFLAGDPAQAVAQGVDFRFEEVRSAVHMISDGRQKVERWQKLFHNFRSHEGILSVANVVLDGLYRAFPNAALKLTPDTGLVQGPRPGLLEASFDDIAKLLGANERIRVLVRDGVEDELKKRFPESEYAFYGIIEAKGLEFSDVLIVDFFSKCDSELQKAWKRLLVDSIPTNTGAKPRASSLLPFPQALELELKLLYTAITRTQNRMHFIETTDSEAFVAWKRLLKALDKAESMQLDAVIKEGTKLMTADEWRVEGIEMALRAEEDDGSEDPSKLLQRSIMHFRKAKDASLEARAQAQLKAMKLEYSAKQLSDSASAEQASDGSKAIIAYLDAGLVGEASRACDELCGSAGLTGLGARIEKLARSSDDLL